MYSRKGKVGLLYTEKWTDLCHMRFRTFQCSEGSLRNAEESRSRTSGLVYSTSQTRRFRMLRFHLVAL